METFITAYLVVGILIGAFVYGTIEFNSVKQWERVAQRIGAILFTVVVIVTWPMIVAYLAPSNFNRKP